MIIIIPTTQIKIVFKRWERKKIYTDLYWKELIYNALESTMVISGSLNLFTNVLGNNK
jgi:hypothetical protein